MASIKNHVLVNGTKIGSATVVSNDLLKKGHVIPGTTITPTSVTFHQTACIDVDAPTMHKSLKNANSDTSRRVASWTLTVGHNKIYQSVPLNWKAYAQGCTEGNNTSISVEICMYTDKTKQYNAYLNAIALYKLLKKEYKSSLVPKAHYDWTKKDCPQWLRAGKYGYNWSWFKGQLTSNSSSNSSSNSTSKPATPTNWANGDYNCKVRTTANLNLRSGRGTEHKVVKTVPKGTIMTVGYVLNKWGSTYDYKNGNNPTYFSCDYVEKV